MTATFHLGHVLDVLPQLASASVHCVITSPPYWGARNYEGHQEYVWGGDVDCRHDWEDLGPVSRVDGGPARGPDHKNPQVNTDRPSQNMTCRRCGAWWGEYGREPTPELYIHHTLMWLAETWRVLRPDGVVWLNLGDSSYTGGNPQEASAETSGLRGAPNRGAIEFRPALHPTLKSKDAILIP